MSARPRNIAPLEYSRHANEWAAHRTMRWLEEAKEGNRRYTVVFEPRVDPDHPWRVLSAPYWSEQAA